MKKTVKKLTILFLAVLMILTSALPVLAARVRERNTQAVKAGCTVVTVKGTFETPNTAALLKRINAIRLEACTAGNIPDPRQPSRMLTKADYVPVKWSGEMEKMAQLRAAESVFIYQHNRPNGDEDPWGAAYAVSSGGENLAAWTMGDSVEAWYAEKNNWKAIKSFAMNTGHYYNLINPNTKYMGLGCFFTSNGTTRSALEVSGQSNLSEKTSGEYGVYWQKIEMTTANASRFASLLSSPDKPATVKVKSVSLNKKSATLTVGEKLTLKATLNPTNATDKTLTWTSSNTAVATVKAGKVTAKKAGSATITVKTANGKTATCKVTIKKASTPAALETKTLKLSKTKLSLTPGQEAKIAVSNATGAVTVKSSNWDTVYAWDANSILAYAPGKATLTFTDASGASAKCNVTVAYKPGENVKIHMTKSTLRLKVGETVSWKATVKPATTTDSIMTYSYSTTNIISHKNDKITALKPGTEKITVRTYGGKTAVCTVIVTK